MKKLLLTGIAALFLATGTAHAQEHRWATNFRLCQLVGEQGPEAFVPDMGDFANPTIVGKNGPVVVTPQVSGSIIPPLVQPAQPWPKPPDVEAAVREINARDFPYSYMLGKLRINPQAWEKFLREQPPPTHIEDRRGEPPLELSQREREEGLA